MLTPFVCSRVENAELVGVVPGLAFEDLRQETIVRPPRATLGVVDAVPFERHRVTLPGSVKVRLAGVSIVVCGIATAISAASASTEMAPRFSFSAHDAVPGDEVVVGVDRAAFAARRAMRLYLAPREAAAYVRSRFDVRLRFIGSVTVSRKTRSRLRFTVPPVRAGSYVLAYWCRGCVPRRRGVAVHASPVLRINAPTGGGPCPVTKPNGSVPRGVMPSPNWHGNGALWASLPVDGVYAIQAPEDTLFEKRIWLTRVGFDGVLNVRYRKLNPPSPARTAVTIRGTLSGYAGPSWASREYFTAGCWEVAARLADVSLSFVVRVAP